MEKNLLANVHGSSSFQLVFGQNLKLPSTLNNKSPALTPFNTNKILTDYPIVRKCKKIHHALSNNIRTSGDVKYITGAKAHYKRANDRRWVQPVF